MTRIWPFLMICGSRKFQLGADGYAEIRSLPWNLTTRAARLHKPSGRGRGSVLRSIQFTPVIVAQGNGLLKFRRRAVHIGDGDRRLAG
jgi:hypothetical protein